mgnify:CR=1 FL=1
MMAISSRVEQKPIYRPFGFIETTLNKILMQVMMMSLFFVVRIVTILWIRLPIYCL